MQQIRNPRTYSNEFVDIDLRLGEETENGVKWGQWMPHTILPDDERWEDVMNGVYGEVKEKSPPRDVFGRYAEELAKGVEWIAADNTIHFLVADNANERDRILSAATRLSINNTLPKNKTKFNYPDVSGNIIMIPKEDVQDVAMLIQDYVEECHDNYQRLLSDTTLDINSGWSS